MREQQKYETGLVKSILTKLPDFQKLVPEEMTSINRIAATGMKRDEQLFDRAAAAVTPVKHTILIEAGE